MTKVTFENATIRDVISKAARVAPTRGGAFDKAAGILMEIESSKNTVTVRATNLEIFYMEVTDPLMIEGDSVTWRLPSEVIAGICSKLPISSGKSVTFSDDEPGNAVVVKSGRMVAKIRLIDVGYYPTWDAFDPDELETVPDFGARIQMVQWAAQKQGEPPLTGVHLTGNVAAATDRFKVALAECKVGPLYKPITIPATIFQPLMKSLGDVKLGMDESHLHVMPDEATQIMATIFGHDYPEVERVFKRNETASVTFRKAGLLEIVDRAMVMGQRDRTPLLTMIIGEEEIAVMMTDKEMGLLGDVLEVPGHCSHPRKNIYFSPDILTNALINAPSDEVTMHYNEGDEGTRPKPVRIDGGSGYEVLIMPRKAPSANEE